MRLFYNVADSFKNSLSNYEDVMSCDVDVKTAYDLVYKTSIIYKVVVVIYPYLL